MGQKDWYGLKIKNRDHLFLYISYNIEVLISEK